MMQGVTIRYGSFLRFSIRPALVNFLYLGHELDESDLSNPQEFTKIYFWTGHKLMSRTGHLTRWKPYSFHIPQHSCRHVGQGNFRRSFLNETFIVRSGGESCRIEPRECDWLWLRMAKARDVLRMQKIRVAALLTPPVRTCGLAASQQSVTCWERQPTFQSAHFTHLELEHLQWKLYF